MRYARTRGRRAGVSLAALGLLVAPPAAGTASAAQPAAPAGVFASAPSPPPTPGLPSAPDPAPVPSGETGTAGEFRELSPAVAERLGGAVRDVMEEAGVPGVLVHLSAPGKGTYQRAFGVADRETGREMSTGLYMRIGSETKTFTVTALLRLVDEGRVALDDPIGEYVDGVPNGDRITLRDLAAMRSGLFNYSADEGFFKELTSRPQRQWTPRELLEFSFRHPVEFEPGAEFQYSNTNTVLLGLVVEKVSGTPLHEYVERNVVEPAGLRHTVFPTDAAFPEPHAHGYTDQTASGKVEDATGWNPSWGWAAGAMISDLRDLRTWARVVATGTLLEPETQAERLDVGEPGGSETSGYGLGIFRIGGWTGHNGSLPGYQSLTLYLPEAKATLVVLLNTDITHDGHAPSTLLGRAITEIVSPGNVYELPAAPGPTASPASPSPRGR